MTLRAARLSIVFVCAVTGCRDWDALSAEYDGGSHDAGSVDAGSLDAGSELDSGIGEAGDAEDSGNGCPSGRGPEMVRVALEPMEGSALVDFCIDATEVTRAQYAEFLTSVNGDTSGQPSECQWNSSYLAPVTEQPDHPVVNVDFCDARAFCSWAGKRLCGGIQSAIGWNVKSPLENEWMFACTKGGTRERPYGNTSQPGACAFLDNAASGPLPAGSLPACEGGFAGIFDMIGNVWEWIDSCDWNTDAGTSYCRFEGGSYKQIPENYRCATIAMLPPSMAAPDIGIRCCASVQ